MNYAKLLDSIIDENKQNIIKTTTELISIKSVYETPTENMPFGKGIYDSLQYILNLCQNEGFTTVNLNNFVGYAQIGEGEKLIAALTHLDVVPAGKGWTYDPFAENIVDNKIIGRGANDNKGPAVASFYAIKAIKDSGLPLNSRFRIIFGCDEETSFKCINHYKENAETPTYSLVPDASFPVTNCEKGVLNFDIISKINNTDIVKFKSGERYNMVPAICTVVIKYSDELKYKIFKELNNYDMKNLIEVVLNDGYIEIISRGLQAHASTPENGVNATSIMLLFLKKLNLNCDFKNFINFYTEKIGNEVNGASLGISYENDDSGKLTLNIGVLELSEGVLKGTVDIRYPTNITKDFIVNTFKEQAEHYCIKISNIADFPPLLIPADSKLVKTLLKTYNEFTGENEKPVSIGFTTYAHGIDNAVAFGPKFPAEEIVAHNSDEYISTESLIKLTKLYARAMYALME
jgi:succinyl-diaminopimelate desuccinylase